MDEALFKSGLSIIFRTFRNPKFNLRMEGSANLYVQGITLMPNEIELVVDKQGYMAFKEAFAQYLVEEKEDEEKQQYKMLFYISSCPIGIIFYKNEELKMFERARTGYWQGLQLPVLPLKSARILYERINNRDKVNIIDQFFKDNPY